jgi:trimethylamine--corrinoid protein Co-methyltransferase
MNVQTSSRSGGRAARWAARSSALPDNLRPVRAGLSGGQYKPLSEIDVLKIHHAALDALETIGLADAPESGIAYLTGAGAILGDDGRIRFARANRSITLMSRDGMHDLDLSGTRVHYGTAGAAVHLVDINDKHYHDCGVQDLHDAARIVDVLDNIHFCQRPMVCRDIPDNLEMDYNTAYACVTGTTKHVGVSLTLHAHCCHRRADPGGG